MNNKEAYIKRIDAFQYDSRKEYEKKNKTITFCVVISLIILDMILSTLIIVVGKDIEAILYGLAGVQILLIFILTFVLAAIGESYFDFFKEIKERKRRCERL